MAARRHLGLDRDSVLVGGVGRLTDAKGFEHLIEAVAGVIRAMPSPGPRVELALVGDGPRCEALEALARRLEIGDRVHFLGRREALERIYPAFAFFVLSSLREGSPNVLYEAMACGVASVATDVGGVAEIVEHDRSCLVVPPAEVVALATAIERLAVDPPLRSPAGNRGSRTSRG